ncbi:hypothetical protein BU25DRAFT_455948 [Macroventuria anomochaeta]|uniref:Uncharacterized protein n=1 Tax=Macroventuria anomochaeta TaxID=301207 RepID=A0ACB6SC27_9PLEO|nr:uncharacterized protein BU25DRAFT_455948 [Macroventuria anomochaeta]KAF2630893.1 hypothetical protein BU25DRAFT_455948 [Macroventuria anomochaeta]
MKVIEKGADRTAHANIYVEGRVQPLEEYGEYVDARDKAICCYVAVEEGHKIRVDGRFSGVTLTVAYDFMVDGVCRKANSYAGKSVQVQKNKKLDFEKLLYQTPDGVIDSDISVSSRSGPAILNKNAPETIGTIELRVYITRQFGMEHEIDDACKYDRIEDDADTGTRVASYKDVPPQFHMTFEKNYSTLDGARGNRERRKVYAKRPGNEPWAIFRFHYRTKGMFQLPNREVALTVVPESILDKKMELTFDPADKAFTKKEPHALELEPVPTLLLGSKPAGKNDGENSVRTSSPAPPDTPATPTKSSKKAQSAQSKVVVKKQQTKSTSTTLGPASEMASTINTEPFAVTEPLADMAPDASSSGDLKSTPTQATDDPSATAPSEMASTDEIMNSTSAATKDGDGDLAAVAWKNSTKKGAKKTSTSTHRDANDESTESVKKVVEKADDKKKSETAGAIPPILPVELSSVPTVPHPADLPSVFDTTTTLSPAATQAIIIPSTKDFVKNGAKSFTSPLKRATTKPSAVDTTTSTVLQKPVVPPTPATLLKRTPEGTLTPPPDIKRIKSDVVPPLTPTHLARPSPASPSLRPQSIEAQVAEQRKRLEATRKKRADIAKEKAAMDERLAPYKQHMVEELQRLKQEMAEEESMMAEEEQEYKASEAMLAEFERGNGDV